MSELQVKDLLEAGTHFGHQTFRWNPKMKPYIYGAKNGVHILDLDQTVNYATAAYKFVADQVALGNTVLFVGTKKQAADIIREQAERVNMYYVNQRWLGGMLTNFKTIKASIDRLHSLYQRRDAGDFAKVTKKEALMLEREIEKLEESLGGIKNMSKLPGVVFLVDPKNENIALKEANKLKIPVVAITDTNCDPDNIDFLIPGNDDAIRSISLLVSFIADACAEGLVRHEAVAREQASKVEAAGAEGEAKHLSRVREKKVTQKARAYVADAKPEARKGAHGGKGHGTHAAHAAHPHKKAEHAKGTVAKEEKAAPATPKKEPTQTL